MKTTKEQVLKLLTHKKNKIYSCYAIPERQGKGIYQWHDLDAQTIIQLDLNKMEFTGHTYEYDEAAQDWTDEGDIQLNDNEILELLEKGERVMA